MFFNDSKFAYFNEVVKKKQEENMLISIIHLTIKKFYFFKLNQDI